MQLVQTRSTQIVSIETILSRTTGWRLSSNQIKRLKVTELPALGLAEDVTFAIKAHVVIIGELQQQIAELEMRLQEKVAPESARSLNERACL